MSISWVCTVARENVGVKWRRRKSGRRRVRCEVDWRTCGGIVVGEICSC